MKKSEVKKTSIAYLEKNLWDTILPLFKTDVFTLKLMILALAKINPDKETSKDLDIILTLEEIYKDFDIYGANKLQIIKRCVKNLASTFLEMETDDLWEANSIIDLNHGCFIDKRNKRVHLKINDKFMDYIYDIRSFLRIKANVVSCSHRAFLFYCALKKINNKEVYRVHYETLMSDCNVNYGSYGHFKNKFLDPVLEELAATGIKIEMAENTSGTKKVDSLNFHIKEEIPIDLEPTVLKVQVADLPELSPIEEVARDYEKAKSNDKEHIEEIWNYFNDQIEKKFKTRLRKLNDQRRREIRKALKDYSVEEIKTAIRGFCNDPFKDRKNFLDFQYVNRQFDKFLRLEKYPEKDESSIPKMPYHQKFVRDY